MSESESFIEEVSEEVRRDRLFKLFRKYGWVLALIVVAIVGGTAYNEWNKARLEKSARLHGALLQAALAANDLDALRPVTEGDAPLAALALLGRAKVLAEAGETDAAVQALTRVAENFDLPAAYSDLAALKILMLTGADMPETERNNAYARLTAPNAPYRLLALEQRAMQYVREGDLSAARTGLAELLVEPGLPPELRNRAQQLLLALGGAPEGSGAGG